MQLGEIWQQLDRLLSVKKQARTQTQAEELRFHVKSLLQSPEGRRSITERLQNKAQFSGKEKFLRELARGLEEFRPNDSDSAAKERTEILRVGISKSSGRKIEGHWDLLWLLIDGGAPDSAEMALSSFMKVLPNKQSDLKETIASLESWTQTRIDRGLAILDAIRGQGTTPDSIERIEKAINWQKGRLNRRSIEDSEQPRSNETTAATREGDGLVGSPAIIDTVKKVEGLPPSVQTTTLPSSVENLQASEIKAANEIGGNSESFPAPRTAFDKESPSVPLKRKKSNPDLFESCISEVRRVVGSYFQQCADLASSATVEQTREEIATLRENCGQLSKDLAAAREELRRETETSGERRQRIISLEQDLSHRQGNEEATRNEIKELKDSVATAREDAQRAHEQADHDIHQIKMERDHAIRTFQSELWDRLRLCLAEVLDESDIDTSASPDEHFFRRRLREIRDRLREMHVPPY